MPVLKSVFPAEPALRLPVTALPANAERDILDESHSYPSLEFSQTGNFIWRGKSREHRDEVNRAVMDDPRMNNIDPKTQPFDGMRMFWGGFITIVDL